MVVRLVGRAEDALARLLPRAVKRGVIGRSGILSSGAANHRPMLPGEARALGYKEALFQLPDGTSINGLLRDAGQGSRVVIASPGFLSDRYGNPARSFARAAHRHLEGTVLILDHATSAPFIAANGASWSGPDEGYILTEVAKQLREERGYASSAIGLFGISTGGLGVMHALYRGGPEIFQFGLTFSAVSDPKPALPYALRTLHWEGPLGPCPERGRRHLATYLGLQGLLPPMWRKLGEAGIKTKRDLVLAFRDSERYRNKGLVGELFKPYQGDGLHTDVNGSGLESMQYLDRCDAVPLVDRIAVPLRLVHARNDPSIGIDHFDRVMDAARRNPNVSGECTPRGGHNGFRARYGDKWIKEQFDRYLCA